MKTTVRGGPAFPRSEVVHFFFGSFVFEGRHAILSFFFLCVCVIVHDCLLAMMSLEVLFSKRC